MNEKIETEVNAVANSPIDEIVRGTKRAAEQIEWHQSQYRGLLDRLGDSNSQLSTVKAELERERERVEKLKRYAKHEWHCNRAMVDPICKCGLDELLNEKAKDEQ